jgi:hypothetical protein
MTCIKIRPGGALALANEHGHHRLRGVGFGDAIAPARHDSLSVRTGGRVNALLSLAVHHEADMRRALFGRAVKRVFSDKCTREGAMLSR